MTWRGEQHLAGRTFELVAQLDEVLDVDRVRPRPLRRTRQLHRAEPQGQTEKGLRIRV
jgi:hypothetical protein